MKGIEMKPVVGGKLTIPEWLEPHKNKWVTAGGMADIMRLSPISTQRFIQIIKPRIKSATSISKQGGRQTTFYLVKQVWACAKAHNLIIESAEPYLQQKDRVKELEAELARMQKADFLRRISLNEAKEKADAVSNTASSKELLRLFITSTEARPSPGVYFLVKGGDVVYIGTSKNVIHRMAGHADKSFDFARMIHIDESDERMKTEARLISIFNPLHNVNNVIPAIHKQLHGEMQ